MTTLNSLTISWAFLTPSKGKCLKKDADCASFPIYRYSSNETMAFHANSKETLLERVNELRGRLGKEYSVLVITDKQFGLLSWENMNAMSVATTKQKKQVFNIQ